MPSARRVNWARFRVLVVSLVAGGILATLAYLLTGGAVLRETAPVYVYVPDATGLVAGQPVRVGGIVVGKVSAVALSASRDPNRTVKVTLAMGRARIREIPVDSTAQISSETMIGDKFVDVTRGQSAERLRPNGEIAYNAPADLIKSLDLTQFEERLAAIGAVLTDLEQGRTRVGQFVAGEQTYRDLQSRLAEAEKALVSAHDTTSAVGRVVYTEALYNRVVEPLKRLDATLARLQAGQGTGGEFLTSDERYSKMMAATRDLRQSIARAGAQPLLASDQMYVNLNRRLASLMQSVDQFNAGPLVSSTLLYDNLNGSAARMRDTLRDFRTDPRKFLRLGIF